MRRAIALFSLGFVFLFPQPGQAQNPPLKFFKNYFVTGDYVVRGVSLWRKGAPNGFAVAEIPELGAAGGPDGVPLNADILAAFLYVQTAEKVRGSGIHNAKFTGHDLGPFTKAGSSEPGSGTFAKALVNWNNASTPCWGVPAPGRKLITYRVDVLRFLPIDPVTQKQALNKKHRIVIPDAGLIFGDDEEGKNESGTSNRPRALGASLVVVYRDATKPFSGIVLYDGAFIKRALAKMELRIAGFYQASNLNPSAKMTHIVGDGGPLRSERVYVGSQLIQPNGTNPFRGTPVGARWDNVTFTVPSVPLQGDPDALVTVDRFGLIPDCLSYSAIVFRTTVEDDDGDGLLNIWEESVTTLYDPNGQPLPKLPGANSQHKDIFAQIDHMYTDPATSPDGAFGVTYGGVLKPHHTHEPTDTSLQLVAEAFKNAPVMNPDNLTGINVHFDVGDNYQPLSIPSLASCADPLTWTFDCAIVPYSATPSMNLARGGQAVDEMITVCPADADDPRVCQFSDHVVNGESTGGFPGTVGWKTGFRFLRDDLRNGPPPLTVDCDAPGNDGPGEPCERRFDANRKHTFHYLFSAHFLGLPVAPCEIPDGPDADHQPDGRDLNCELTNPDFNRPRTNSAITDFPGADGLLTLGAFDDALGRPVGTPEQQGATIMHEWGHNFELKHGGPANPTVNGAIVPQIPREPNCKSNYLSVMNYLFQLRLLPDVNGIFRMDFSRGETPPIPSLNESGLPEAPLGSQLYRTGWYAPWSPNSNVKAATKHCDGSEITQEEINNGVSMMRIDASSVLGDIDWNADGAISGSPSQDINFNGLGNEELKGASDDWGNIRLQETAGRRNVGGLYIDTLGRLALGPMSADVGSADIGSADIGSADIGSADIGSADIGSADIGSADIGNGNRGSADIGSADIGRGSFGGGDTDVGGENEPPDDFPLHVATAPEGDASTSPPSELCLTSDSEICVTDDPSASTPVNLTWQPPKLGPALVVNYKVFRFEFEGEFVAPAPADLPTIEDAIATVTEGTSYSDDDAPAGAQLAYFIRATWVNNETDESGTTGISNFATVTTPSAGGAGVPAQLAFIVQPSTATPGDAITPAVQVAVVDATGNIVPSATLPVTLVLGANPGEATLSGDTTQNAVNGIATFTDLSINSVASGYTLIASSSSLPDVVVTSNPFDVTTFEENQWKAATICATGESPQVVVTEASVTLGVESGDTTQPNCIHSASQLLPPLTEGNTAYRVTFTHNLYTWDAYNEGGTPGFAGTGYWDSFSVSVSNTPYKNLGLTDAVTTGNLPGLGFIWGGNDFADNILECNPTNEGSCAGTIAPTEVTVDIPGNLDGDSYLNVVLDTWSQPYSNHAHPSWGTITIVNIEQVTVPAETTFSYDAVVTFASGPHAEAFPAGEKVVVTYTLDPLAEDSNSDPGAGIFGGAVLSMSVSFPDIDVFADAGPAGTAQTFDNAVDESSGTSSDQVFFFGGPLSSASSLGEESISALEVDFLSTFVALPAEPTMLSSDALPLFKLPVIDAFVILGTDSGFTSVHFEAINPPAP